MCGAYYVRREPTSQGLWILRDRRGSIAAAGRSSGDYMGVYRPKTSLPSPTQVETSVPI